MGSYDFSMNALGFVVNIMKFVKRLMSTCSTHFIVVYFKKNAIKARKIQINLKNENKGSKVLKFFNFLVFFSSNFFNFYFKFSNFFYLKNILILNNLN